MQLVTGAFMWVLSFELGRGSNRETGSYYGGGSDGWG